MADPNQSVTPPGFPQMGWPMALPFTPAQAATRPTSPVVPPPVVPQGMPPSPQDPALAVQAAADRARIMNDVSAFGGGMGKLGAAALDVATLPARGVMGAANTLLRIPNAFGAGIPYIPEQAFGGSSSSLTPYYDKYIRANGAAAAPADPAVSAQPLDTAALARAEVQPQALPDVAFRGQPPLLQAAPSAAAAPAEDTAPGSWARFAAQDRTFFDPFNRGGGGPEALGGGVLPARPAYAAAPMPAGAPAVGGAPDLGSLFMAQESSGGKTAPENPMQIQEDTFNRYARPGESYANTADKTTVANRMLSDYYQRYGGDLGRVATAYFSGEGNVAPAGSATPYLKNTQDKNGKDVQSYVSDIVGRAGGASGGSLVPGGMVASVGLRDPYSINQAAFGEQYARGAAVVNPMLQWIQQAPNIFDRAGRIHAVAALMPAMGPNDIGQTQGAGTNAWNQAVGGLAQRQAELGFEKWKTLHTPVAMGQTLDTSSGYPIQTTTMGVPVDEPPPSGGGMPAAQMQAIGPEAQREQSRKSVPEGTRHLFQGRWVVMHNGQWQPEQQ